MSFNVFGANVSLNLPELNVVLNEVQLTSTPLRPYNPCNYIPATITCSNDLFNLEITLTYPITVTTSNLGASQVISLIMTASPQASKEFNSFLIKEGGSIASFPRNITSNGVINYQVEIKMDYMGFDSIPENASFFVKLENIIVKYENNFLKMFIKQNGTTPLVKT